MRNSPENGKSLRNYPEASGTPEGTRTPDLLVRNQTLYPLSYGRLTPNEYTRSEGPATSANPAGREGFEPSVRV